MLSESSVVLDDLPTMRDLADALVMDQSTIGQNLRPLEREGLVLAGTGCRGSPAPPRKAYEKSRSRIAVARPLWEAAQARFENHFGVLAGGRSAATLLSIAREPSFIDDAIEASPPGP